MIASFGYGQMDQQPTYETSSVFQVNEAAANSGGNTSTLIWVGLGLAAFWYFTSGKSSRRKHNGLFDDLFGSKTRSHYRRKKGGDWETLRGPERGRRYGTHGRSYSASRYRGVKKGGGRSYLPSESEVEKAYKSGKAKTLGEAISLLG